jgi:hypothetical protein
LPLSYNTIYDLLLSKKITDKTGVVASVFWKEISEYSEMLKDIPDLPVVTSGKGFETPLMQKDGIILDAYENELDAFFEGKYIFDKIQLQNKDDILNPSSTNKQIANLFKIIKFVTNSSGAIADLIIKDLGSFTPTKSPLSPKNGATSGDTKSDTKVDDKAPAETSKGDAKSDTKVDDKAPAETSTKSDTPSFVPSVSKPNAVIYNEFELLKVTVDADTIIDEATKTELLELQSNVIAIVADMINKSVEVKTNDIPVVNVGVKLPKAA